MTTERITIKRDAQTGEWLILGMGNVRTYGSWVDAYRMAEAGAAQRRKAGAGMVVSRQLAELHRPIIAPYPGAPGFHSARCRICDGVRAVVRVDGSPPYGCPLWVAAVRRGWVHDPRGVVGVSTVDGPA